MSDPTEHFRMAMAVAGLTPPEVIHPDGAIHRFSTSGKRGDDSGWYLLHSDGVPAGLFGDWRTGLQSTWCSKTTTNMSQAERDAHRQRVEAMRRQRETETAQRQDTAAEDAERRWHAANPCTGNAYLTAKGVLPHGTRMEADGALIVPMRDAAGKLWNIERINPADFKDKRGLPGGRRTGCYFGIGKPDDVLIVCEGFATGASIHECTGKAAAVAFNAGNLEAVATALHRKYPALTIILAADDDHQTDGNPGLTKAMAAALAVGGLLAEPEFSDALKEAKATDFNDLHQLAGVDAVRACIDAAKPVATVVMDGDTWPELQPLLVKFKPEPVVSRDKGSRFPVEY